MQEGEVYLGYCQTSIMRHKSSITDIWQDPLYASAVRIRKIGKEKLNIPTVFTNRTTE